MNAQDLNSISTLVDTGETDPEGNTIYIDRAQQKTGEYFQDVLMYSLQGGNADGTWVDQLCNGRPHLTDGLKKIQQRSKTWFENVAVPNMGMVLHGLKDEEYANAIDDIADKVIELNYKEYSKSMEFSQASQDVYVEACRDSTDEFRAYLDDDSTDWGQEYYAFLTSDSFLENWSVQVASDTYGNVKRTMHDQYMKLTLLCPEDSEIPRKVLTTMLSTILTVNIDRCVWDEGMRAYIERSLQNMTDGKLDFENEVTEQVEEFQEIAREMKETLNGDMGKMVDTFVQSLFMAQYEGVVLQRMNIMDLKQGASEVAQQMSDGSFATLVESRENFGAFMKTTLFGAFGGFFLNCVFGEGSENIIEEVSLALIGGVCLLSSGNQLIPRRLGKWVLCNILVGNAGLLKTMHKFQSWFSKEGVDLNSTIAKMLGEDKAKLFARRLGPAFSVLGVVLSGFSLKAPIKPGYRDKLVFETLKVVLEVERMFALCLPLNEFAWAGPVGLVIAIAGLMVAVFQPAWTYSKPPPLDPVRLYVSGPLRAAGFTLSRTQIKPAKRDL